jgi:hypothetical protein
MTAPAIDRLTVLDEREVSVPGRVAGDRALVDVADLRDATGWTLEQEGLCRGDVCVPVRDRAGLIDGADVDLAELAHRLGRVVAIDLVEGIVALGGPAPHQRAARVGGTAPDVVLADLDGREVRLADLGRRKRLLLAWASW